MLNLNLRHDCKKQNYNTDTFTENDILDKTMTPLSTATHRVAKHLCPTFPFISDTQVSAPKPRVRSSLARRNTDEDVRKTFELFDDSKTGYILLHNLKARELARARRNQKDY
jgi:hypothetical protein